MKKTQYMAPQTVSMQIQSAVSLCDMFSAGGGDTSFFGIGAAGDTSFFGIGAAGDAGNGI